MTQFIGYTRVSTRRQERSGLGLEAQRAMIDAFIAATPDATLLCPIYAETETGADNSRPVLAQAIARCHQTGAVLLAAKLDRLSRDVEMIAGLIKRVPFQVAEHPNASVMELHIRAMIAQEERDKIGERTKAALAALKARGGVVGGDRGHRHTAAKAREFGAQGAARSAMVRSRTANRFASEIGATIATLRADGIASNKAMAAALNAGGVAAPRDGAWTATAVRRVLARLDAMA
jgi:DNA invertase Pin-like site-specific DNA recombinase